MKRIAVIVVTAGCSALFGIDRIPYEGPDGNAPGQEILLTVGVYGSGSGTISDGTGTIACESGGNGTCNNNFAAGSTITLTPNAGADSAFFGWGQACSDQNGGSSSQCTLTGASGGVYVVANFSPFVAGDNTLTLTPAQTNYVGSGAFIMADTDRCDDGMICVYSYNTMIPSVTLGAVGNLCAQFMRFTGGGCGSGSGTCTVPFSGTAGKPVTVDYEFAATVAGSGSGSANCL